jgi:hypothetical protein
MVINQSFNHHHLEAGGLAIGGLNRRLEEKAAGSRWFVPWAECPSGGLKQSALTFPAFNKHL